MQKNTFTTEVDKLIKSSKITGLGFLEILGDDKKFNHVQFNTLQFEVNSENIWNRIISKKIGNFNLEENNDFSIKIIPEEKEFLITSADKGDLYVTLHDFKNYDKVMKKSW